MASSVVGRKASQGNAFVYVIEIDGGPVKIGRTNNSRLRLREFQMACPLPMKIAFQREMTQRQSVLVETAVHRRFRQAKVRGEWFEVSAVDAVRKGERGTQVVLVKKISVGEEEADDRKQVSMLKTFTVFNVAQVEGLTNSPAIVERITPVSEFVAATKAEIRHGHPQAFYSPGHDAICLPNPETFEEPCHYDATLLHELTHWTGHKSRLDRQLGGRFGSEAYAAEELVAELGAAFLCPHLGVKGMLRHAGYIEDWLRLLKGDNRAIFTASAKAAQAVDFLRSFSEANEERTAA